MSARTFAPPWRRGGGLAGWLTGRRAEGTGARQWLTLGLWAATAAAWLGLAALAAARLGWIGGGAAADVPSIAPLRPAALPALPMEALPPGDNPFDAKGMPWRAAEAAPPPADDGLHGLVLLPGVRAALTGGGPVRVGEALGDGRLAAVGEETAVVEGAAGRRELPLNATPRPSLRLLNAAENKVTDEKVGAGGTAANMPNGAPVGGGGARRGEGHDMKRGAQRGVQRGATRRAIDGLDKLDRQGKS